MAQVEKKQAQVSVYAAVWQRSRYNALTLFISSPSQRKWHCEQYEHCTHTLRQESRCSANFQLFPSMQMFLYGHSGYDLRHYLPRRPLCSRYGAKITSALQHLKINWQNFPQNKNMLNKQPGFICPDGTGLWGNSLEGGKSGILTQTRLSRVCMLANSILLCLQKSLGRERKRILRKQSTAR